MKLAYHRYYGAPLSVYQAFSLRVGKYVPDHWRLPHA
jgi:hypothetical protein